MNDKLRKFIEQNIDFIEENKFDELYSKIPTYQVSSYSLICGLSLVLLEASINPLSYMSNVPHYFLYESTVSSVDIPIGVQQIDKDAFAYCENLTQVDLPEGLTVIGEGAFFMCSKLKTLILPSTLTEINSNAFSYCDKLVNIHFRGTVDQWLNVIEEDDSLRTVATKIICSDGIFDFE